MTMCSFVFLGLAKIIGDYYSLNVGMDLGDMSRAWIDVLHVGCLRLCDRSGSAHARQRVYCSSHRPCLGGRRPHEATALEYDGRPSLSTASMVHATPRFQWDLLCTHTHIFRRRAMFTPERNPKTAPLTLELYTPGELRS